MIAGRSRYHPILPPCRRSGPAHLRTRSGVNPDSNALNPAPFPLAHGGATGAAPRGSRVGRLRPGSQRDFRGLERRVVTDAPLDLPVRVALPDGRRREPAFFPAPDAKPRSGEAFPAEIAAVRSDLAPAARAQTDFAPFRSPSRRHGETSSTGMSFRQRSTLISRLISSPPYSRSSTSFSMAFSIACVS